MQARRRPPSMMELCDIFRKGKEFMWKPNQPGSEFDETQHDTNDPFTAQTTANERDRPMCYSAHRPTVHELEMEDKVVYPEKPRNHPQFSPPAEFYESDAVVSSSDEEFYAFDDGSSRPDLFQKQQAHRMKTRNVKLHRTACAEMSPTQGTNVPRRDATDTENSPDYSLHRASCSANHANFPGFSHRQPYLPNQVNSRGRPRYQSSHHSFNRTNCRGVLHHQARTSPSTQNSRRPLPAPVQDRNGGKQTSHQNIRSSAYLQQQMQREEATSTERRNVDSNRAVTMLPPIQRRTRITEERSRQSQASPLQRNQVLLYARRCGRQEVCEARNSECSKRRRTGVCKETDNCRENRTFVRVLQKRF